MDRHVLALVIQHAWNSFGCSGTTNLSYREGVSPRVKSSYAGRARSKHFVFEDSVYTGCEIPQATGEQTRQVQATVLEHVGLLRTRF